METKLTRITELAKTNHDMVFTSLAHLLNEEMLKQCHHELPKGKATGVKGVTKEDYGHELDENIKRLVERLRKRRIDPFRSNGRTLINQDQGRKDHSAFLIMRIKLSKVQ